MNSFRGLDIDLGVALAHTKGHGILAAHLFHHFLAHVTAKGYEDHQGQHKGQKEA